MGYTRDLLDGLAREIATAGIGTYHDAAYAPAETGIGVGQLPQTCDAAIGLSDYLTANESPNQALSTVAVQVWIRGRPNDRDSMTDLRDAVFLTLHGLTDRQYGACHVIQALRRSSVPMGLDGNGRSETADNYYIDINPPETPYRNQ